MKFKKLTLVKYDFDSLPENCKIDNKNPFENMVFIYFGQVSQMKDHSFVQCIDNSKCYILDTNNLISLTDKEL